MPKRPLRGASGSRAHAAQCTPQIAEHLTRMLLMRSLQITSLTRQHGQRESVAGCIHASQSVPHAQQKSVRRDPLQRVSSKLSGGDHFPSSAAVYAQFHPQFLP